MDKDDNQRVKRIIGWGRTVVLSAFVGYVCYKLPMWILMWQMLITPEVPREAVERTLRGADEVHLLPEERQRILRSFQSLEKGAELFSLFIRAGVVDFSDRSNPYVRELPLEEVRKRLLKPLLRRGEAASIQRLEALAREHGADADAFKDSDTQE